MARAGAMQLIQRARRSGILIDTFASNLFCASIGYPGLSRKATLTCRTLVGRSKHNRAQLVLIEAHAMFSHGENC